MYVCGVCDTLTLQFTHIIPCSFTWPRSWRNGTSNCFFDRIHANCLQRWCGTAFKMSLHPLTFWKTTPFSLSFLAYSYLFTAEVPNRQLQGKLQSFQSAMDQRKQQLQRVHILNKIAYFLSPKNNFFIYSPNAAWTTTKCRWSLAEGKECSCDSTSYRAGQTCQCSRGIGRGVILNTWTLKCNH